MGDKENLLKKYEEYKNAYYNGEPLITDGEFDAFEDKLIKMGIIDSAQVGEIVDNNLKNKVKHPIPMLSLDKNLKKGSTAVTDLLSKSYSKTLTVTLKLDGNSLGLVYEYGKLTMIKTRGNGEFGFNVSNRLKYMPYIPNNVEDFINIPYIEVRGELLIDNNNFKLLSQDMISRHEEQPKNQRNIVAGLLNPSRQSNLDLIKYCSFYAHGVDNIELMEQLNIVKENQIFNLFKNIGFKIPLFKNYLLVTTNSEVDTIVEDYKKTLENNELDILTDGLVFTLNDIKQQIKLGCNNHGPRYKLAYKLLAEIKTTTIEDFTYSIGTTGKLTIVANVEPVELSGATVAKATMHNAKRIITDKICKGSVINIMRSGEVIPKYLNVIFTPDTSKVELPEDCPSCGSKLEWSKTGVDLVCNNSDCRVMNIKVLVKWAKILEIEGLSIKTIQSFYDENIINEVKDIFYLSDHKHKIVNMTGFGLKKYNKLIEEIEKHKNISFAQVINGTSIPGVGDRVSGELNNLVNNIDEFKNLSFSKILGLQNYGEIMAKEIINGMNKVIDNYNILTDIPGVVITFGANNPTSINSDGKKYTFVITGTLSKGRKDIEKDLTSKGHSLNSSISKNVDYLVCNEGSRQGNKYNDAMKLNIPIISEDELNKLIGE